MTEETFWSRGERQRERERERERGEAEVAFCPLLLLFCSFFFSLLLPFAFFSSSSFFLFFYSRRGSWRGRGEPPGERSQFFSWVLSYFYKKKNRVFVFVRSSASSLRPPPLRPCCLSFFLTCSTERRARHLPGQPVESLPHALLLQGGDPTHLPGAVGSQGRGRRRGQGSAETSLLASALGSAPPSPPLLLPLLLPLLRPLLPREPERPRDLPRAQRAPHVLLVRQHQQRRPGQPLLGQQRPQLERAAAQPRAVRGVDDPAEPVGLLKVVAPERPQGPLPADVPEVQARPRAFVPQGPDLEAEGRGDGGGVAVGEGGGGGGLAGVVEAAAFFF